MAIEIIGQAWYEIKDTDCQGTGSFYLTRSALKSLEMLEQMVEEEMDAATRSGLPTTR